MMNHQDIFSGLFGGVGGLFSSAEAMLHQAFHPKSDDITVSLEITLSDVYLGKKKSVVLDRKKGCGGCRGAGRVMTPCRACQGQGISMAAIQPFPGYIQQVAQECQLCRGTGYAGRGNCPTCHGQGAMVEKRQVDVRVPRDCKKNHELVFDGLGHHLPGEESGDAVVVLRVQDHPVFTRRGAHLFVEKEIYLTEALCGVEVVVNTLDGRSLLIRNNPSAMIKPSSIRVVESEGMPVRINRSQNLTYGNLYIKFKVKFPESLDHETCEKLKCLMTASPPIEIDRSREDVEEVRLDEFDTTVSRNPLDEESDDDYSFGEGIQCVHQ